MRILVLGGNGMLGKEFVEYIRVRGHDVVSLGHADIDITEVQSIENAFREHTPEVVINCAAYTAVDQAEGETELAYAVNGEALGHIGAIAQKTSTFVVHFSTDYVFDGTNRDGYAEDENRFSPLNVYGASKYVGEQKLKESGCNYAIVRISWLFGPYGKNFVQTMLELALKGTPLRIVNDQFGKPTYTLDVVHAVTEHFIENKERKVGVYHLPNEGVCSWHEFAEEIFTLAGRSPTVTACASTEYERPARRPACSILRNTKLPLQRSWKEALREYLKRI